jgi:hypothetical protein
MPGGVRLPKKPELPKYVPPASLTVGEIWAKNRGTITQVAKGAFDHLFKVEDKRRITSDFNNDEFRFWIGAEPGSGNLCLCRSCRSACYSRAERRAHLKSKGCAIRLVRAYKILLDEKPTMKCVVCSSLTNTTVWGIPMCPNGPCMNRWKYMFNQWGPMCEAFIKLRQQEWAAAQEWEAKQRQYGVLRAEDFQE